MKLKLVKSRSAQTGTKQADCSHGNFSFFFLKHYAGGRSVGRKDRKRTSPTRADGTVRLIRTATDGHLRAHSHSHPSLRLARAGAFARTHVRAHTQSVALPARCRLRLDPRELVGPRAGPGHLRPARCRYLRRFTFLRHLLASYTNTATPAGPGAGPEPWPAGRPGHSTRLGGAFRLWLHVCMQVDGPSGAQTRRLD